MVKEGLIRLRKIGGEPNRADMLTKYLGLATLQRLGQLFGVQVGIRPIADAEGECW